MKKENKVPTRCPICGGPLRVDEEYMADHFGSAYGSLPWRQWSFYCTQCDEAGPYAELKQMGKERNPNG